MNRIDIKRYVYNYCDDKNNKNYNKMGMYTFITFKIYIQDDGTLSIMRLLMPHSIKILVATAHIG